MDRKQNRISQNLVLRVVRGLPHLRFWPKGNGYIILGSFTICNGATLCDQHYAVDDFKI